MSVSGAAGSWRSWREGAVEGRRRLDPAGSANQPEAIGADFAYERRRVSVRQPADRLAEEDRSGGHELRLRLGRVRWLALASAEDAAGATGRTYSGGWPLALVHPPLRRPLRAAVAGQPKVSTWTAHCCFGYCRFAGQRLTEAGSASPSRASCTRKFAAVVKTWPFMPSAAAASTKAGTSSKKAQNSG